MPITDTVALVRHRRRGGSPQQTLTRFHQSGLTQRAFCEQTGLPVSTLQWWLARAWREAAVVRPITFTEVSAPPRVPAARATSAAWAVEIVTPSGLTVRMQDPLGPIAVRALLRGPRC